MTSSTESAKNNRRGLRVDPRAQTRDPQLPPRHTPRLEYQATGDQGAHSSRSRPRWGDGDGDGGGDGGGGGDGDGDDGGGDGDGDGGGDGDGSGDAGDSASE